MTFPDITTLPQRPDLAPLLRRVESMGISCELGFVQRHCHAGGIGLLRFAHSPVSGLVTALSNEFSDFAEPARLILNVSHYDEWMCVIRDYWFEFHTMKFGATSTEDEVRAHMADQLGLMTRIFMEHLRAGEKIFIYRPERPGPIGPEAFQLRDAMHRFGAPVLLWLDTTDDPEKQGTVEWIEEGSLMLGYLDRFANPAPTLSFELWLRVIAAAVTLRDAGG